MIIRLVTNFLRPTLSKSMVVRSTSDSATIPKPYCSCLMHCPSERTCTNASLSATGACGAIPAVERVCPVPHGGRSGPTFVRLEAGDVLHRQTLGALADLEFDGLAFV